MPRSVEMAKSRKGNKQVQSNGLAEGRVTDQSEGEIRDQHEDLREELMQEVPRVFSGKAKVTRIKQESEVNEDNYITQPPAGNSRYQMGELKGLQVKDEDAAFLQDFLTNPDEWIAQFGAVPTGPVLESLLSRYRANYDPTSRRSMIRYTGNILKAMGFSIEELEEDDTRNYTLQMMVASIEQFRIFTFELLLYNGLVARTELQPSRPADTEFRSAPVIRSAVASVPTVPTRSTAKSKGNKLRAKLGDEEVDDWDEDDTSEDETNIRRGSSHFVPASAISKFSGKMAEAEEWLNNFVYIANQAGWTNKLRCETFRFRLEGAALWWYKSLTTKTQKNWTELQDEFKRAYEIGVRSPQARYWNASRKDQETPLQFLVRLNALAKMAKINKTTGSSAADHVQQFLTKVKDNALREKFLMMGTKTIAEVETRLREVERGERNAKRSSSKSGDDKRRVESTTRKVNYGRAAPAYGLREVRWADDDRYDRYDRYDYRDQYDQYNRYDRDEEEFDDDEEEDAQYSAYQAREEPSVPPRNDYSTRDGPPNYRRRDDGYSPRRFQDWSTTQCRECRRWGHPTERCLFKCKTCNKFHEDDVCPVNTKLQQLAKFVSKNRDALPVSPDIQQILKDLNF